MTGWRLNKLKMKNHKPSTLFIYTYLFLIKIGVLLGQSLARHKTVSTSPTGSSTGKFAVDGDYSTNWQKCADTGGASNDPWVLIDLGAPIQFNQIVVYAYVNWHTQSLGGVELYLDNVETASIPKQGNTYISFHHFSFDQTKSAREIKFLSPGWKRLFLCEVDVFFDTLISQGKPTITSSTLGFGNWNPSFAVDGNSRRDEPDTCQCCAATNRETDPWLEVDLGASFFITLIQIYGRNDAEHQEQSYGGLQISIDGSLVDTITSNGAHINYHGRFVRPETIGQKVRLTLIGYKLLVVCELVIYGERVISIGKSAEMSSQYEGWVPERGVGGSVDTLPNSCFCCSATVTETNPWFEIDLGQVHEVKRIVIYGRTDGQYNGQTFDGMTISLNSTVVEIIPTTSDWINYYAFQLNSVYLANIVTLTLVGNNQQLVVCELLVYGDCMAGFFGKDCTQCHCEGEQCSSITGVCPSGICKPGYKGVTCSQKCSGNYGQNCSFACGKCKDNQPCDHVTGHCIECADGYINIDPLCKTTCQPGVYGRNCSQTCGHCRNGETCHFIYGQCSECADGYKNSDIKCKTECDDSTYGSNCQETCGNCRDNEVCDKTNGHCTECIDGFSHTNDPVCKTVCKGGTYGRNCGKTCGACRDDEDCNVVNGDCRDCKDGYLIISDKLCQSECGFGKYGYNCTETCGNCRNDETCGHTNGECNSCADGYNTSDIFCKTICNKGNYGYNCEESCGSCYGNETCHHMNGSCSQCSAGFTGVLCAERLIIDDDGSGESLPIGVIIGVAIPVVVILSIVLVVFVIFRRRRQPKEENHKFHFEETGRTLYANNESYDNSVPLTKDHAAYSVVNTDKLTDKKALKDTRKAAETVNVDNKDDRETYYNCDLGVRIHQLWDYIRNNKSCGFETEYSKLKDGLQFPVKDAMANRAKNRYKEMYPYDHSRVHLMVEREGESEFINASHINGYDGKPKFIASQGPVEAMIDDFWRMVWQKGVTKIVMVTNLMEGGSHKCLQYWPDKGEVEFKRIRVKLVKDDNYPDYSIRALQIIQDDETPRNIYQYHYKAWPDKDVPDSTWSLTQFWREVFKNEPKSSSIPIVVHCSAGVGRTGTFIALDNLYHQAIDTGSITPFAIVEKLREQRVKMVQTCAQYVFLHEAVADALLFGTHYIWQSQFPDYYDFMIKKDKQREKIRLKLQFEYVEKSLEGRPREKTETAQLSEDSIYSNEDEPPTSSTLTEYKAIEPVFLPSLNGPNSYLLTKIPTKESIGECLQLIDDYNIKLVITINEEKSSSSSIWSVLNDQICPQYKPELVSDKKDRNLTERAFTYSKQKAKSARAQIKQLELPFSLSGDPDQQAQTVSSLLDRVNTLHPFISTKEPVLIQSRDGVTTSSIISVLLNEKLRMVKDGGQINILESVMLMRQAKKSCIESYKSFKFIHDMVLHMVEKKQPQYDAEQAETPEEENIYQNT